MLLLTAAPVEAQKHPERDAGFYPVPAVIDAANPAANVSAPARPGRMLIEDFEGTAFPPAGWTRFERLGNDSQRWIVVNVDGNRLAYNRYSDLGSGVIEDWLVTPLLSVTASDNTLSFDMAQQFSTFWGSTYTVAVSTGAADQASDFVPIASWTETEGPEGQPTPPVYSGPSSFATYTLDLSDYVGQDVYVAFIHENEYGDSFLLDNVSAPALFVADTPPQCVTATSPSDGVTGVPFESVVLSWDPPAGGEPPSGYLIDIGTDPGATNIANGFDVGSNTSIGLENADPDITYYYRVTPYNGAGSASGCATVSFTTGGPRTFYPYTEDFDDAETGCEIPVQWTVEPNPTSNEQWLFRQAIEYGASQDHTSGAGCFAAVDDSSPDDTPTGLLSPFFDFSALTAPTLSFWVQNRGGDNPFSYSDLFVDVTLDRGETYDLGVGAATGRYRNWTKIVVDLSAYAGEPSLRLRFRGVESSGGFAPFRSDLALDDVFIGEDPTGALFAISPGSDGAFDFGAVIPCAGRERVFTIINDGVRNSTLNITAAQVVGDAAFSIVDIAPTLPVVLGQDETAAFRVQFNPTDSEVHTATAAVTYTVDGGAEQTFNLVLQGEGDQTGLNSGTGAGYVWRNSTLCSSPSVGLEAVGFGAASGDTEITAWTQGGPNDGFFTLDLTSTIGSFRFFGEDYDAIHLSTNGYIFFDFGRTSPGPPFPANGDFENAYIAALGDDLTLGTGGSLFYRGENLDADGTDDRLVITYFRVRRFNFPDEFATFQVILQPGATPGTNGTVKLQYLSGPSPDDGQPLSQGFNNASSFNQDARIGITGDQGYASVLYRDNGDGGALFGGNNLALEFAPRIERLVGPDVPAQRSGWRMLSAPTLGMTVANLAEQNLVQGIADEFPVDANGNPAAPNLYTSYSGDTGFQRPAGLAAELTPGKGFIWFFFDIDYDPEADANIFTGDGQSYPLPAPIVAAGRVQESDVLANLTSAPDGNGIISELLGNPFDAPLDISGIGSWTTGSLASTVGQVWDPATRTYIPTSTLGDVLSVWQGAFFENDTATEITYPLSATQPVTAVLPSRIEGANRRVPRRLQFELQGTASDTGTLTTDRAIVLEFSEAGTPGWDPRDATKLSPLVGTYATLAFGGERDGAFRLKAQESRALAPGVFDVPLYMEAAQVTGDLRLSWTLDDVPADWTFILTDQVTGDHVDLRAEDGYRFQSESARPADPRTERGTSGAVTERLAPVHPSAQQRTAEARFVLTVAAGQATATAEDAVAPARFALAAPYPNPFSNGATLAYDVPEAARVRLAVYDALGRRVALLVDENAAPGAYDVEWRPMGLPSGLYLVRMEAGPHRFVRKLTHYH